MGPLAATMDAFNRRHAEKRTSAPPAIHRVIYSTVRIPAEVTKPVKTWHELSP